MAKFDEANPWKSSSGSSSEDGENEEEEEEEEIEDDVSLKSDHEFSPESDLEQDDAAQPLRRARTAQKCVYLIHFNLSINLRITIIMFQRKATTKMQTTNMPVKSVAKSITPSGFFSATSATMAGIVLAFNLL